ncbi:PP2C family serine/threonine-protein phosphatase [Chitinophaga sp.]|uniref:PP2C family serine/threonine-protein phosphatase n=1 Tax=Chitinophaga sp. TaxID=1869181 RepID=UPI0031D94C0E
MENHTIKNRINDIITAPISIPNGSVNKPYKAVVDFEKWNMGDVVYAEWKGLEEIGLVYNKAQATIEGTPTVSGDLKIQLLFSLEGTPVNVKVFNLIINPDPRSLWKDIASDVNDPYWKQDDVTAATQLCEKQLVVASKRGRSHKNVGAFRDDDFAYHAFENKGWSVVAVADGAGSSPFSRKGAQIACNATIEYFQQYFEQEIAHTPPDTITAVAKKHMYIAVKYVFEKIKGEAARNAAANPSLFDNKHKSILEYYHTTLIFVVFKKFDFGYLILSFGVGDCPIVLLQEDQVQLLNQLDIGEFGGGTRFITQPEIFHSKEIPMESRFNVTIEQDFSYLFLMTDGIYDPKFEVEYNLQNLSHWKKFMADLNGDNEAKVVVDFNADREEVAAHLSAWMDFWSPGNHDDRTLAIIY